MLSLNDKAKDDYLKSLKSGLDSRAKLIATLDSDELKEEYLKKIKSSDARAQIIASLSDEKLKEKYLKNRPIKRKVELYEREKTEKNESRDFYAIDAREFALLGNDKVKKEYIDEFIRNQWFNVRAFCEMVSTLDSDELKKIYLLERPELNSGSIGSRRQMRQIIVSSMDDDEFKKEEILKHTIRTAKDIVISMKDDELKKDYLNSIGNAIGDSANSARIEIVCSMTDDKYKIAYIKNLTNSTQIEKILISLGKEKIKEIKETKTDNEKKEFEDMSIEELLEMSEKNEIEINGQSITIKELLIKKIISQQETITQQEKVIEGLQEKINENKEKTTHEE